MLFVNLYFVGEVRPVAPRAGVDVPEVLSLGTELARIVEGAGGEGADAQRRFQGKAEVAAATAAECNVKPAAGLSDTCR